MNRSPAPLSRGSGTTSNRGFTLVELLVVIVIMVIMLTLSRSAFQMIRGGTDITRCVYGISEALEQARTYAVGNNTYVWVGIFEEDADKPGHAGTGRVLLSVVASKDGSNQLALTGSLNSGNAAQISNLLKSENLHINDLSQVTTSGNMRGRPTANRNVTLAQSGTVLFTYPLGSTTSAYRFQTVVQFSPTGDSVLPPESPVRWTEIGLLPTHGTLANLNGPNLAAIQIAGIGGQVMVYRP